MWSAGCFRGVLNEVFINRSSILEEGKHLPLHSFSGCRDRSPHLAGPSRCSTIMSYERLGHFNSIESCFYIFIFISVYLERHKRVREVIFQKTSNCKGVSSLKIGVPNTRHQILNLTPNSRECHYAIGVVILPLMTCDTVPEPIS